MLSHFFDQQNSSIKLEIDRLLFNGVVSLVQLRKKFSMELIEKLKLIALLHL